MPSSLQRPSNKQVKCKHSILEEQGEEFSCVGHRLYIFFSTGLTFFMLYMCFVLSLSSVLCSLRKKPVYSTSAEAVLTHLVAEPWPDAVRLCCFPEVPPAATASSLHSRGEVGKLAGDREGEISSRRACKQFLMLPLFPQYCPLVAFAWNFHFWYSQILLQSAFSSGTCA